MDLTEEEAKGKWCCGPQTVGEGLELRCQGSACMAWRWLPLMADDAFAEAVKKAAAELSDKSPNRVKAVKHVTDNRAQYGLPTTPYRGYCGLAGKPTP